LYSLNRYAIRAAGYAINDSRFKVAYADRQPNDLDRTTLANSRSDTPPWFNHGRGIEIQRPWISFHLPQPSAAAQTRPRRPLAGVLPNRSTTARTYAIPTPFRTEGESVCTASLTETKEGPWTPVYVSVRPGTDSARRRAIGGAPDPSATRRGSVQLPRRQAMPPRQAARLNSSLAVSGGSKGGGKVGHGPPSILYTPLCLMII
jgi:hypothetical protein